MAVLDMCGRFGCKTLLGKLFEGNLKVIPK